MDYNRITGRGLKAIAQALEQNSIIKYIALWGNTWDTLSSEAFCKLLGGACSVVMVNAKRTTPEKSAYPRFQPGSTDVTFSRYVPMIIVYGLIPIESKEYCKLPMLLEMMCQLNKSNLLISYFLLFKQQIPFESIPKGSNRFNACSSFSLNGSIKRAFCNSVAGSVKNDFFSASKT